MRGQGGLQKKGRGGQAKRRAGEGGPRYFTHKASIVGRTLIHTQMNGQSSGQGRSSGRIQFLTNGLGVSRGDGVGPFDKEKGFVQGKEIS